VAAGIAGFVPSAAAQITSIVVQVAAGTAREVQSRHRRNNFLDRVNQDLFMPRGLFAMLMAFKDEVPGQQSGQLTKLSSALGQTIVSSGRLDINQTVAKYASPNIAGISKLKNNLRLTSGETHGEMELPEAAPLVYPDLDRAAAAVEGGEKAPEGTREKLKGAGAWVQDYMDRKAQASYVSICLLSCDECSTNSQSPGSRASRVISGDASLGAQTIRFTLQRPQPPGE
jgi:hypothetical protein